MTTLADFRVDLRAILAGDSTVWTDAIVDEALRAGLDVYGALAPVLESSFAVATGGYSQDISSVTDLQTLLAVAWPWEDGAGFADYMIGWRWSAEGTIILGYEAQAGDVLRLRYRRRQRIDDLDGAAATTIWASEERLFLLYAAAIACDLRGDVLGNSRTAGQDVLPQLAKRAARLRADADDLLVALRGGSGVAWGGVGL